jgi:hypothetical protein
MSARIIAMRLSHVWLNVQLPRSIILAARGTAKVPGRDPKYWEKRERRVSSSSREEREKKITFLPTPSPSLFLLALEVAAVKKG